mmetsp:Transcript_26845/g.49353  ORF Transcript_26845/g.49353 Transcript_26845/m.49353 type:complete len:480 (+) Transcript_26845:94-1533(+)
MANLIWLGIVLQLVSTASGTVGKQLIRISEVRKKSNPAQAKSAFVLGLFVNIVCGPIVDMAAYSFAPQSLIAPFGGLDVVWNALSAPYVLQEKLTFRRGLGCVLICVGTVCAGAFGSHEEKPFSIEFLEDTLIAWRVFFYFAAFTVWFLINVTCMMHRAPGNPVRGISLGLTAGTLAGNMFCVKAAVEIIQYCIEEETAEPWAHWLPYAVLFGAAFFALSNLKFMTQGLKEFEALFMVTVYEGSMIVAGAVSGSVVLLDLENLEAWRVSLYWLGVATIVAGMGVVFSNELMNRSSLQAGTASIVEHEVKKLQSMHSALDRSIVSPMATTMTHPDNPDAPVCKVNSFASHMSASPSAKRRLVAQACLEELTIWPVTPQGQNVIKVKSGPLKNRAYSGDSDISKYSVCPPSGAASATNSKEMDPAFAVCKPEPFTVKEEYEVDMAIVLGKPEKAAVKDASQASSGSRTQQARPVAHLSIET